MARRRTQRTKQAPVVWWRRLTVPQRWLAGGGAGEALEVAVLMLMERLTPTERAAYVLREAFDYPYEQIAEIINASEAGVRQLVSRVRKRVGGERQDASGHRGARSRTRRRGRRNTPPRSRSPARR
ncbi:hypothetical protein OHA72_50315 [Dactylosporangium sp. NBC_01737]|uniref:sigma factor-like helix-turn-helix DNA-binding protein n=1 Tax=Dactylosporangium sp. NBC_01737 TaxID=2975959 RepID=UPI002E153108|nr:hypothetical protein OHA72_50315 [Dactylosporangium sp. NBC_01737]